MGSSNAETAITSLDIASNGYTVLGGYSSDPDIVGT